VGNGKEQPNRLKNQFCFRTQDAVEHLEFIGVTAMATSDYDNTVNYKATDSDNAYKAYPMIRGAILHSDRSTQCISMPP